MASAKGTSHAPHRVLIAKHPESYLIEPRTLKVRPGENVVFSTAGLKETIYFFFPESAPFGKQVVELRPENDRSALAVKVKREGVFPYAAYSKEGRDFIGFHSRGPVIIIYT